MAANKDDENFISQVRRETYKYKDIVLEDIRSKIMNEAKLGKNYFDFIFNKGIISEENTLYISEKLKNEGFKVNTKFFNVVQMRIEW
uniref:Uncharacterized protein n=1 Tax=viral metagenome TaxID=1070528 RepID=A0A6C0AFS5_9ZZZZ